MAVLERDYRIDGIKWLLIVLVTFGHVIEPALSNPIANKLYSIIYIFHMPLFVFISGYYANVKDKEKLISKGFMLLETFLVVMIPQCFYYGSIIPLLNPENSGWYLISLITWYIIFLLIINKLVGKIVVQYNGCGGQLLIFSCLLAVFAYMLPLKQFGNLLSFQRSCMFLPFFYNPQIQISAESETKRSIFREKDKTKRSKKESAQHSKSRNKSFVMTSVSAL